MHRTVAANVPFVLHSAHEPVGMRHVFGHITETARPERHPPSGPAP